MFVSLSLFAQHPSSERYLAQKNNSHNKKEINFNGQWKGGFDEDGNSLAGLSNDDIRYVLELTVDGSRVSGYSYTYFQEGDKKYYTICRLSGTLDRETNDLVVTEIERTKFNTPPNFENCFQTHRLHYEKGNDDMEVLRGTWIPAPNQGRGCGSGTTVLSRRIVSDLPIGFMPPKKNTIAKKPAHQKSVAIAPPAHKQTHEPIKKHIEKPEIGKIEKSETVQSFTPKSENTESEISNNHSLTPTIKGFESRKKDVVKTISIEQPTFHLDFYDNGEIDGDSITVFFNGKIVLSHQRLSDKPISLDLTIDKNIKENIVTMYADNLGTIPPNTALMIVTDGGKRYEVRMESDYGKSGSVIFVPVK